MDAVLAIFVNERFVWGCSHPHNFVSSFAAVALFPQVMMAGNAIFAIIIVRILGINCVILFGGMRGSHFFGSFDCVGRLFAVQEPHKRLSTAAVQ